MDRTKGVNYGDIGGGRRGFQDQNAVAGIAGTRVDAAFLNGIQEEIIAVIEAAGITPSADDWQQLLKAIKNIYNNTLRDHNFPLAQLTGLPWLPVISMSQTTPPTNPKLGDLYLVPNSAKNAWSGKSGQIAEWNGETWLFTLASNGHGIGLPDGQIWQKTNGAYVPQLARDSQSGKWNSAVAAGSPNVITTVLNPPPEKYSDGMLINLQVKVTSTSTAPTINVNGLGEKLIVNPDGSPLMMGALVGGARQLLTYNIKNDKFLLLTTPNTSAIYGNNWIRHSDGTYEAWGQVVFSELTTTMDVSLPITFPLTIDSVLITDTGAGVYVGAGSPLNNSRLRCYVQPFIIDPFMGVLRRKSGGIVLWWRCWGR